MKFRLNAVARVCAIAAVSSSIGLTGTVHAEDSPQDVKQQLSDLQKQIEALKTRVDNAADNQKPARAAQAAGPGSSLERSSKDGITFETRGGEVTFYGQLDVSVDTTTKGIADMRDSGGNAPAGNGGWMPAISTNLSYVGLRGQQAISDVEAKFVWQLETQIDIAANSGGSASNSNNSDVVKGALTSRNSFIGLASPTWGAVKIGKTDAPYKTSTGMMNPFLGMLGDYSVIMGNSGGDNRVEFGTRLEHAIWYESPNLGGFAFKALVSPGQNRATDNSNLASGSADCAGGNVPGSGGTPVACNDGSFGTAYSASAAYQAGGLYLTAAYELHNGVNRTSDLATWDPNDIADESATKVGAQYKFATGTTVSAIYESLKRNVPAYLDYQNERTRTGYWLAVSQQLDAKDSLHLGWAHANASTGDPGVHNSAGGLNPNNAADMLTLAMKHQVDRNLSYYANYATTINQADAHYDLGAGGRAVTTDCHDASNPDQTGFDPNGGGPRCWAGGRLQGVSVGMKYVF